MKFVIVSSCVFLILIHYNEITIRHWDALSFIFLMIDVMRLIKIHFCRSLYGMTCNFIFNAEKLRENNVFYSKCNCNYSFNNFKSQLLILILLILGGDFQ